MKYKAAIFDMDGTILNTLEDLCDTMNYCLEKYHMPERTIDEIRSFVGNGIRKLVERAVAEDTDSKQIDEIFAVFLDYYKDHCAIKTRPYDGIAEVIRKLKENGIKTAVVSNKADAAVKDLCDDYFPGLFDFSVGDKEGQRRKPYPDGVFSVMEHFGMTGEDVVYIGDSDVDYQTARNADVDVIMVGWGFRSEEFLKSIGVQKVIHKPEEIAEILEG